MKNPSSIVAVLSMIFAAFVSTSCAMEAGPQEDGAPVPEEGVESVEQATHGSYRLTCDPVIVYESHTGPDYVCAWCRNRAGHSNWACAYECNNGLTNCDGRLVCASRC